MQGQSLDPYWAPSEIVHEDKQMRHQVITLTLSPHTWCPSILAFKATPGNHPQTQIEADSGQVCPLPCKQILDARPKTLNPDLGQIQSQIQAYLGTVRNEPEHAARRPILTLFHALVAASVRPEH